MKRHAILNWTARISGLIVIAFFVVFFIAEGSPGLLEQKTNELLGFLLFALPVLVGFILAWRKPVSGGWLIIAGTVLLVGYLVYYDDTGTAILYGLPLVLVGLCFLAAGERTLI